MTPVLALDGLTVSAGGAPLVDAVSCAIERGQSLTILGETGSGKSLLAHALMGTLPAGLVARGDILIHGVSVPASGAGRQRLWGRTLALLPQEPWRSLDPTMRTASQVAEGFLGTPRAEARTRAAHALRSLGLESAGRLFPFMLSGGMAQRVALAATGAGGASIVVVDEPTKGLDANLRDDAIRVLREVLTSGRTLLTITHDVYVARALGGHVAVMLDGRFVEQGPAEVVLVAPQHEYTRRLLAAEPTAWPRRTLPRHGEPVLSASRLTKRYGAKTLFTDLDLEVCAGERIAVVGPSGSGKTTLGDVLVGVTRPDAGTVWRPPHLGPFALQKLYQDPPAAFAPRQTIGQSIDDVVARHRLDPREVTQLMARLRLDPALRQRRPDQVSGGELQRFALVRLLVLSPALVFADEPTSRLDPITQQETIDLLVEHTEERGCALLVVTHDAHIGANVAGEAVLSIGGRSEPVP